VTRATSSPTFSRRPNGSPILAFAGLWDRWRDRATAEEVLSCMAIVRERIMHSPQGNGGICDGGLVFIVSFPVNDRVPRPLDDHGVVDGQRFTLTRSLE
jgi:hypothetical protein